MSRLIYDGVFVGCVDGAWCEATHTVAKRMLGGPLVDPQPWPGGAKALIEDSPAFRLLVHNICKISLGAHGAKTLIVFNHASCLAYGGGFTSLQEEMRVLCRDVARAGEHLSLAIHHHARAVLMDTQDLEVRENLKRIIAQGVHIRGAVLHSSKQDRPVLSENCRVHVVF